MSHLVKPIDTSDKAPLQVSEVIKNLRNAHEYLAKLGVETLQKSRDISTAQYWGSAIKRLSIIFPDGERPELISISHDKHSLIEVINQCATMERLIDALEWAHESLPDYHLLRCHPTTSSQKSSSSAIPDNDIVLIQPHSGRLALFEVSDVANSSSDSNQKEFKDLKSLGIRLANMPNYSQNKNPFRNRLFMIVSTEFGGRIQKRSAYYEKNQPYFRYNTPIQHGKTYIFEITER